MFKSFKIKTRGLIWRISCWKLPKRNCWKTPR